MSKERFKIETQEIILRGVDRVEFDPSKVVLFNDTDGVDGYDNTAERCMFYKYEDLETALKIFDLNYSLRCGDSKVELGRSWNSSRENISGLNLFKRISTKLRKRPNKNEFSKASLEKHEDRAKSLDKYDLAWATEQFKLAVEEFNVWYVEEQTKRTLDRYSEIGSWKFDDEKEIIDLDEELQLLSNKIQELREKRFDKKCELVLSYVGKEEEKIHGELKTPLINAINEKRGEGYKGGFFL